VHISATRRGLDKLRGDLVQVLRLMDLANLYDKRIAHPTWQAIRESMISRASIELSPAAAQRFLSLLSQPAQLGDLLRRLHQLRVLEKLIPAMAHARCLLQFNEYHKYTVDEHSIRAVEIAANFQSDEGVLGEVYRSIKNKRLLHLAVLMHDLGKGFTEDHSDVGMRLAVRDGAHLGLRDGDDRDAAVPRPQASGDVAPGAVARHRRRRSWCSSPSRSARPKCSRCC
jgi:[protein-PII] uridylyltransferase